MILSDLASPAEASGGMKNANRGFAQAGNRFPLFGIMRAFRRTSRPSGTQGGDGRALDQIENLERAMGFEPTTPT
jgi:hypothetical protein